MVKVAICEDSQLDREMLFKILQTLLQKRGVPCEIESFVLGEELLEGYGNHPFDIVFLDIMMGEINGMEVGRQIRNLDQEVEIVYCTSSKEFAIDAYEVHAMGYLLKPYEPERIDNVIEYFLIKHPIKKKNYLEVKSQRKSVIIPYSEIIYMESDNKVVYIHTLKQGTIKVYTKLDSLEEQVSDERFLRCHQSYYVNLDFVSGVMDIDFVMNDERRLPIRKSGRKLLIKKYEDYLKGTL